jgi:hypothetical protein
MLLDSFDFFGMLTQNKKNDRIVHVFIIFFILMSVIFNYDRTIIKKHLRTG